ncbi:MAG: sensor histidine kinase [Chitinophagaceae bacterium]|nr:MAG: sensor histidine kinase [Chitinophagaceae bacterium]
MDVDSVWPGAPRSAGKIYVDSVVAYARPIAGRRLPPGFGAGELIAWLALHFSWPLMLGTIYYLAGKFADPAYMSLPQFASIQLIVSVVKAVFLLPLWWFFFVHIKVMPLRIKLIIHPFTSLLFVCACLLVIRLVLTQVLMRPYSSVSMWSDVYNLLLFYFSNFAVFHAYNFWLHTQRQTKKERQLRELAYQSEIRALKSQIEPHFLFNTLNSISASVPASLEHTRVLIARLADTFRYALRVSERTTVTLEEELEFVKNYLTLEKYRFGDRLIIRYYIDEAVLPQHIPALILQPLIENAIRHGISPLVAGGVIEIDCRQSNGHIHVSIADTGVGYAGHLPDMFNKGIGLGNTSKRLLHLYNEQLEVERLNKGLRFSFKMPANSNR